MTTLCFFPHELIRDEVAAGIFELSPGCCTAPACTVKTLLAPLGWRRFPPGQFGGEASG